MSFLSHTERTHPGYSVGMSETPEQTQDPKTPAQTNNPKKRTLESPTHDEPNKKATAPPTIFLHTKHKKPTQTKDATDYFNSISNNVLILSSREQSHGTVIKIYQKDITKALSEANWKTKIDIKFTNHYINHYSYCLINIDAKVDLNEIKQAIETTISKEIILINRTYHGIIHFITEDLDHTYYLDTLVPLNNQRFKITSYDPLTNYIYRCPNCHSFQHTKCNKKTCAQCHKENCKSTSCPKDKLKSCLNCKGNHSTFYRGCPTYKEALQEAYSTRIEVTQNKKINALKKSVNETNSLITQSQNSYANITRLSQTNNNTINQHTESLTDLQNKIKALERENLSLKEDNKKLCTFENQLSLFNKSISNLQNRIHDLSTTNTKLSTDLKTACKQFEVISDLPEKLYSLLMAARFAKSLDDNTFCSKLKTTITQIFAKPDSTKVDNMMISLGFKPKADRPQNQS